MNFELRLVQLRLGALEKEIAGSAVSELPPYASTAELWSDADAFVTDDAFALSESPAARRGALGVLTRHARPLSWLFFSLREIRGVGPAPVELGELAGRLADAASGFLAAHQPEGDDWRPLLLAVVGEARRAFAEGFATSALFERARLRHRPARLVPELAVAA